MNNCENCKYATWDYETFYGTTKRQYFVTGCKKGMDDPEGEGCEGFDEDS